MSFVSVTTAAAKPSSAAMDVISSQVISCASNQGIIIIF